MPIVDTFSHSGILPAACIAILTLAAFHDIISRTIPNYLVVILVGAGLVSAGVNQCLLGSILVSFGIFLLAFMCWRQGWMGGGDVKLLGAAALGIPASSALPFMAAVAIAGGCLSMFYLIGRLLVSAPASRRPQSLLGRAMRVERWRISRGGPLPYACAIAAGALFVIV